MFSLCLVFGSLIKCLDMYFCTYFAWWVLKDFGCINLRLSPNWGKFQPLFLQTFSGPFPLFFSSQTTLTHETFWCCPTSRWGSFLPFFSVFLFFILDTLYRSVLFFLLSPICLCVDPSSFVYFQLLFSAFRRVFVCLCVIVVLTFSRVHSYLWSSRHFSVFPGNRTLGKLLLSSNFLT